VRSFPGWPDLRLVAKVKLHTKLHSGDAQNMSGEGKEMIFVGEEDAHFRLKRYILNVLCMVIAKMQGQSN